MPSLHNVRTAVVAAAVQLSTGPVDGGYGPRALAGPWRPADRFASAPHDGSEPKIDFEIVASVSSGVPEETARHEAAEGSGWPAILVLNGTIPGARKVRAMKLIEHQRQETVDWRPGVATRMLVSAITGSVQLCIFEQFCEPGLGAPMHMHAVEEVLEVVEGSTEIWVGDETVTASGGHSVIIPAGVRHGFRNTAKSGLLHVRATLASPIFEASYDDRAEQSRRYLPST